MDALDGPIAVAPPAPSMEGAAGAEVEDREDAEAGGTPMRVLIHEFVTGGGLAGAPLPASWAAEGGAMRRALAADCAALPGIRVVVMLDDRLPDEPGPWSIVRVGPGREEATFARLAAEADYTALIAPEAVGLLTTWARGADRVGG